MARFTIDDCMENIDNRYILTLVAAIRARLIERGEITQLECDENDKPTVLALREIAENLIDSSILNKVGRI